MRGSFQLFFSLFSKFLQFRSKMGGVHATDARWSQIDACPTKISIENTSCCLQCEIMPYCRQVQLTTKLSQKEVITTTLREQKKNLMCVSPPLLLLNDMRENHFGDFRYTILIYLPQTSKICRRKKRTIWGRQSKKKVELQSLLRKV